MNAVASRALGEEASHSHIYSIPQIEKTMVWEFIETDAPAYMDKWDDFD